jgi:DNA-binding PadR family transcriptional regulator
MTNAELAVLSLVAEQPRHGYEIEQVIEERGMREWTEIGFSSIYYLLKKLEEKGFVASTLEKPAGRGPARKVYRLTGLGQEEWYKQSLEMIRTPVRGSSPFLMGLSVLPALSKADSLPALREYLASLEQRKKHMLDQAEVQQPLPTHVEAMFDYSRTLMSAEIEWLKAFINQQEEHDGQD